MLELNKIEELRERAITLLGYDETFAEVCDAIDWECGLLGDSKCYPMHELNDLLYGFDAGQIIDLLMNGNFNKYDEYFYFTYDGLMTTSDRTEVYLWETDVDEVVDILIEKRIDIDFCGNDELVDVINEIHAIQDESEMLDMFATIY